MFRKTDQDQGFPKAICDALHEYDRKKGARRKVLGDQAAIAALRALPQEKRSDNKAIMECFNGVIITEDQASYGVYSACCNLIIENHDISENESRSVGHKMKESPPREQSKIELINFISQDVIEEVNKIWERHKKEKHVCSFMQPASAYTNKQHAQQDHDYYTGLVIDRINSNELFCQDEQAKSKAIDAVKRLTNIPLKNENVSSKITVSQLLFLLDHAANHKSITQREKAAAELYTALSQLPFAGTLDLNSLVHALAGYHPDVLSQESVGLKKSR